MQAIFTVTNRAADPAPIALGAMRSPGPGTARATRGPEIDMDGPRVRVGAEAGDPDHPVRTPGRRADAAKQRRQPRPMRDWSTGG